MALLELASGILNFVHTIRMSDFRLWSLTKGSVFHVTEDKSNMRVLELSQLKKKKRKKKKEHGREKPSSLSYLRTLAEYLE